MISTLIPVIPDVLFQVAGVMLLFGWYGSLGHKQIRYVKDTWQDRYQRKSWTTPLLIGFAGLVASILITFILGFVAVAIM